jgi:hypothetical protein
MPVDPLQKLTSLLGTALWLWSKKLCIHSIWDDGNNIVAYFGAQHRVFLPINHTIRLFTIKYLVK